MHHYSRPVLFSLTLFALSPALGSPTAGAPLAPQDTAISLPEATTEGTLTLPDALRDAVRSHPSITWRREERAAADSSLETAKWARFPALSAQSTAGAVGGGTWTSVRLDQPLWTGGRITADIDSRTAGVEAAKATVEDSEQVILVRTASTFTEIIRLQSRIAAAKENIAEHQRLLDLISRRSESQVSPASEVTMARSRLQQSKTEAIQLQVLAANAIADLEQLTGHPVKELKVPKPVKLSFDSLDKALESALNYSPRLRKLAFEKQSAEAAIRARKGDMWPQLIARHEQFWGGENPGSQTYLAVAFQPGSGLSALSNVREAESRRNAAVAAQDNSVKEVADAVRADWNQMNAAREEVAVLRELVESSRNVYESFVRQYSAGRKTWIDVLNARRDAIQARNQLADTEWGGFLAGVRIAIATGTLFDHY